jgi:hypothetical protein
VNTVFQTGAEARKVLWQSELDRNRVETKPLNSPFRDLYRAFCEYQRLGYAPVYLNDKGKPTKILPVSLAIPLSGLCLATCGDGMPAETIHDPQWAAAPCFRDSAGGAAWMFACIGDYILPDVLGYGVQSKLPVPEGFPALETFLAVPPQDDLVFVSDLSTYKRNLPAIPTALRNEIIFQARDNV